MSHLQDRLADQCCETCGSLEGVDQDSFAASRVFGYDWAAGSVAPWRDAQGRAYATPAELAESRWPPPASNAVATRRFRVRRRGDPARRRRGSAAAGLG